MTKQLHTEEETKITTADQQRYCRCLIVEVMLLSEKKRKNSTESGFFSCAHVPLYTLLYEQRVDRRALESSLRGLRHV